MSVETLEKPREAGPGGDIISPVEAPGHDGARTLRPAPPGSNGASRESNGAAPPADAPRPAAVSSPAGPGAAAGQASGPPPGSGAITPDGPPKKRKRPSPLVLGIAAVAAVLGLIFGIRWFHYNATHVNTDDAQVGGDVYAVSAKVSGYLTEVVPAVNTLVHKGDILVRIDPSEYQTAVDQAEANLNSLTAAAAASGEQVSVTRAQTGAGVTGAGAGVQAARANVGSAAAKLSTSREGVNAAAAQYRSAVAASQASRQAIVAAEADVQTAQNQLASAQAGLRAARANEARVARDTQRYNQLYRQGAVAQQMYDAQRSALASAVAESQQAEQTVQEGVARINQALARVESARANAAQSDAAIQQAQVGEMQARDNVTQSQAGVQQAIAQLNQSSAALQGQQSAPGQVRVAARTASSNSAKIQQAKAQLAQARLQLSYCTVRAPADGYVTSKSVEPGQLVQPGQPLMSIIPLTSQNTYVDANFKETQMQDLKVNQPAEIVVDAYGGKAFKGHVRSIGSSTPAVTSLLPAENATGNFVKVVQRIPVRVSIDQQSDPNRLLRLGMSVEVTIDTSH